MSDSDTIGAVIGIAIFLGLCSLIMWACISHNRATVRNRQSQPQGWSSPPPSVAQAAAQTIAQAQAQRIADAQARQAAAKAALDTPVVVYDRWGNPHVTTQRNQGVAAIFTLVFLIGGAIWYFSAMSHLGSQDCTTTMTSEGGPGNSTSRDVTVCK